MILSKRKTVLLVFALIMSLVFVLSACGSSDTTEGSNSGTGKSDSDVLRVGVDDCYPPMEYKDENGKDTIGFDVDVAKEVAKRLGKSDVKFISNDWDGIFAALETDKFDCIISSVSINEERKKAHSLTKPYVANKLVLVTSASNKDITSPETLSGKKVGSQSGTTSSKYAEKLISDGAKFEFTKYDLVTEPFQELKIGRLDAIIVDIVVAQYYVAKDKESYKVVWESADAEPMAICCQKDDTELRDKIDKILDDMRTDGTMKTISEKWFGKDITSNLE